MEEKEMDLQLAANYAASAYNALKSFEYAWQVLQRAQTVSLDLIVEEKKLVALQDQVKKVDDRVKAQEKRLAELNASERQRTMEITKALSEKEQAGLAASKEKLDAARDELDRGQKALEAFKEQNAKEVQELMKETGQWKMKLAEAQKAYDTFIQKIAGPGK